MLNRCEVADQGDLPDEPMLRFGNTITDCSESGAIFAMKIWIFFGVYPYFMVDFLKFFSLVLPLTNRFACHGQDTIP
jgi:hypothetical protein